MARLEAIQRSDGYYECKIKYQDGSTDTVIGYTADNAIAKAQIRLAKQGGAPIGGKANLRSNQKKQRKGPIRGSYKANIRTLNAIFGDIKARAMMASSTAASASSLKVTDYVAESVLKKVYNKRGKFNTYTGNLERAYTAIVVQGRNIVSRLHLKNTPKGNEIDGKKKKVYIYKERHDVGNLTPNAYRKFRSKKLKIKYTTHKRVRYRYVKRWERKDGYRTKSTYYGISDRMGGFGRFAGDRNNRIQSGIIIENSAPYAGAVQAAGYDVIPHARTMSYNKNEQKKIVMVISKRMLKAAGLLKVAKIK